MKEQYYKIENRKKIINYTSKSVKRNTAIFMGYQMFDHPEFEIIFMIKVSD